MSKRKQRVRRMVVREDIAGRGWQLLLTAATVVLLVGVAMWFAGRHFLYVELTGDVAGEDGASLLDRLAGENRGLRDELAVYRSGQDLVREVEERVRSENRDLQDRIAELEQALAYYRRVVMPDRSGKGLHIERVDVAATDVEQVWSVSVFLLRTGETDGEIEGRLEGRLIGEGPAGRVEMPIAQLLSPASLDFRVRYVEELKSEIRLPAGVVPVRMDVVAVLSAPRPGRVESSWQRPAIKSRALKLPEETRHAGQE